MIHIKQLMHAGLIVSDLKRSREFYEGLLGLSPNPNRPDFSFEGVWYDIGANQLHLMVVPNPYEDVVRPEHGGRDNHVAFSVEDVVPIREALDKAGVPYSMSKSGRAAVFCRDPDGNALEFSAVR
ncbi:MAG TPA: VOC family protein [Methylophilaceae bacterium]|nr:VOC family protein [Methylophilaceae bacterium]